MVDEFLDTAWSTWCTTMAILTFLCLGQTMLDAPKEVWVAALATDLEGFQIDIAPQTAR